MPNLISKAAVGRTNGKFYKAQLTKIASLDLMPLEKSFSGCNGVDQFGATDPELNQVRKKYGECLTPLLGTPRLILQRNYSGSPLMTRLWYTYNFDIAIEPIHYTWVRFSRALRHVPISSIDAEFIDWDANVPGNPTPHHDRFELSLEFVGPYKSFAATKRIYREFMQLAFKGK